MSALEAVRLLRGCCLRPTPGEPPNAGQASNPPLHLTAFPHDINCPEWRKYTGVRNTLAGEESQVELLKAQLKELFRFSEDSRHLSHDVLAVVKEHQSVKSRATRLCSESESGLRNILQDPLLVFAQWSHMVFQVLENSAEVTDFSNNAMMVQNIELRRSTSTGVSTCRRSHPRQLLRLIGW
ncbi:nesprin-3-like [Notothenia coriiceps]|uniref:Nesprin-3-like n=1 Tax=Notothenia coriiceps TaxID=8208 RepID=A0A6I9N134_9TELE|nr:PREDICTED: nesprin-3-like [Notothenia coriiceps]